MIILTESVQNADSKLNWKFAKSPQKKNGPKLFEIITILIVLYTNIVKYIYFCCQIFLCISIQSSISDYCVRSQLSSVNYYILCSTWISVTFNCSKQTETIAQIKMDTAFIDQKNSSFIERIYHTNIIDVEQGFSKAPSPYVTNNSSIDANEKQIEIENDDGIINETSCANLNSNRKDSPNNPEYTAFLNFLNKEYALEYREFLKTQNNPLTFRIFALVVIVTIITRIDFSSAFNLNRLYASAVILLVLGLILWSLYLLGRQCNILFGRSLPNQIQGCLDVIINSVFHNELESIIAFVFATCFFMVTIAKVLIGECPQGADMVQLNSCNTFASSKSPPIDMISLLFMSSLCVQMFIKNVRKRILVFDWIMSVIVVIWSVTYLDGWTFNLWLIPFSIACAILSYEIERIQMSMFVNSKRALNEEKSKREQMAKEHAEKDQILTQLNETKLKEEQNRINLEILELQAKNEVKLKEAETHQLRALMGNVAHDLKTPIHSVVMDIDVLKSRYVDAIKLFPDFHTYMIANEDENPLDIFDSLEATCKFMTMGINKCQDYTKSSSNMALKPSMETFELISALTIPVRCIMHHLHVKDRNRVIIHPVSDEICSYVISDKHWFSENLLCYLSNAIKYSDKNTSVDVKIELINEKGLPAESVSHNQLESMQLSWKAANRQMIRVSVEDRGVGIAEDERMNLFSPFKQAQRMAGGTGLGLYSLRKRLEALNGYCGVNARSDGLNGSVFWFAFPYRPDLTYTTLESKSRTSAQTEDSTSCMKSVISLRVLLVDDSPSILKITSRALRSKGHHVEVEENGSLGLQKMKSTFLTQEFDVLITDLQMPVMDGFTFVKRFRQYEEEVLLAHENNFVSNRKCNDHNGRFLIIGMSANSDEVSKQDALMAGFNNFISKPFVYDDFWNAVKPFNTAWYECNKSAGFT